MKFNSALHPFATLNSSDRPNLRGHIPSLDGIRALAILLVMMLHLFQTTRLPQFGGHTASKFIHSGWVGLDLFFVLSGFLITGILEENRKQINTITVFYTRRILRIFPLYMFALTIILIITPAIGFNNQVHKNYNTNWLWIHSSNIQTSLYGWAPRPLIHFWSLAMEEQFYLLWPPIMLMTQRRTAIKICLSMITIAFISRLTINALDLDMRVMYTFPFARLDGLALGSAMALLLREYNAINITFKTPYFIVVTLVLPFVFIVKILPDGLKWWCWSKDSAPFLFGMVPMFCSILLFSIIHADKHSIVTIIFTSRVARFLGKHSYSVYIFHMPIDCAARALHLHPQWVRGEQSWIYIISYAVASILVSYTLAMITWTLIEKPILRFKQLAKYNSETTNAAADIQVQTNHRMSSFSQEST